VRAREGADPAAVVTTASTVGDAIDVLRRTGRAGVAVIDPAGRLVATCSATELLALLVPDYYEDDPTLAGVVSDSAGAASLQASKNRPIGQALPRDATAQRVAAEASMLEVAVLMARRSRSAVAVVDGHQLLGVLDVHRVLAALGEPGR
jgi:CBS domain-containing protein